MGIVLHENYMDALNHSIQITPKNGGAFYDAFQQLVKDAKVPGNVLLEYVPSNIANATCRNVAGGKAIGFSNGLCHLLDYTDLRTPPNGEMLSVMGHELSHARYRWQEVGTRAALLGGIPLAGMGAMYLIDKTNEKLRDKKQSHADKPESWWAAFQETLSDAAKRGPLAVLGDFAVHTSPTTAKALGLGNSEKSNHGLSVQDQSWAEAIMQEAKYFAVGAAMLVPALALYRQASLAHEFRADKFAVALTGNKDMANALLKLEAHTGKELASGAKTALQKGWASRVMESVKTYFREAMEGAHPDTASRVAAIERINIAEARNHFGL